MTELKRTPLYEAHKALGAKMTMLEAPFEPEGGAYTPSHVHGHAHHDHDHAHDHHGHPHDHDH